VQTSHESCVFDVLPRATAIEDTLNPDREHCRSWFVDGVMPLACVVEAMSEETPTRQDRFATRLGLFLAAVGVRGLSRERVLGLVGMNRLHAVEHIAVGVAGIAAGASQRGRAYSGVVAVALFAEVVLGLLPWTKEWFHNLFNADRRTTAVQLAVALVSLRAFRGDSE